jgi:hypothetical protein
MSEKRVKYDKIRGDSVGVVHNIPVAASQAFKLNSGKFVKLDANKRADIADSGDSELFGWALVGGDTTSSSDAGGTKISVDTSPLSVFELPIDETLTETELAALLGETCDLIVTSDIQYADVGESSEDTIQIVGYDVNRQTVHVRMNPNKMAATGVV